MKCRFCFYNCKWNGFVWICIGCRQMQYGAAAPAEEQPAEAPAEDSPVGELAENQAPARPKRAGRP